MSKVQSSFLTQTGDVVAYFYFFCMMLVFSSLSKAQNIEYYTNSGHAEFTSSVPLHEFTGVSNYLTGIINLEENVIDFYLDLSTLDTGNSRRDRDMYRTLNVDEYPFAEFTGTFANSFDANSSEPQRVRVTGEFTMHGVTREKMVVGTLQKEGELLRVEAEWVQDMTEHDIEPPGILMYRVRDEMDVRIEAVLHPREIE